MVRTAMASVLFWVSFCLYADLALSIEKSNSAAFTGGGKDPSHPARAPFYIGYLWHLHQPLYWPNAIDTSYPRMERAWETIQRQDYGRAHPQPERLRDIFSVDDRVHVYQWRMSDALRSIFFHKWSGAQVSFSGALMENIQSLGEVNALGYSAGWLNTYRNFSQERNESRERKMDMVNFNFHHSLGPLLTAETLEMEIRLQQYLAQKNWGVTSRGYFPTEMAFTASMIPILKRLGIEWTIVGNNHLARASKDYPVVVGSGGENCDLPNLADQLNPAQGTASYLRLQLDRGVSPAAPAPFAFFPHRAEYIDPETGEVSTIELVPADQAFSWKDGYSPWDINLLEAVRARSGERPPFFLLAHDGDNAWGGGYSYYQEWVRNFGDQAKSRQMDVATVEAYRKHHPVPADDIVHIESGAWVNAEGDFGSPQFINWHWPPSFRGKDGRNVVDPSLGVSDKADFWRVNLATENMVKTAQQIHGVPLRLEHILNPVYKDTSSVERAWHFYLGGLDSGFVYYGCHGDECERAVVAQHNSIGGIKESLLQQRLKDKVGPTLFAPQRHPWNPGGRNFGVQYNYRILEFPFNNFFVWTYGYDVNGINKINLVIRYNGLHAPREREAHLYKESSKLGRWSRIPLHWRLVETVLKMKPEKIADYYWVEVKEAPTGYADYFIEAEDGLGNWTRTAIQHVYIGR